MSVYRFLYGASEKEDVIDVTNVLFQTYMGRNEQDHLVVCIPPGDRKRSFLFNDPARGKEKIVFVYKDDKLIASLDQQSSMTIPLFAWTPRCLGTAEGLLHVIHSLTTFHFGSLFDELTEQLMICRFLPNDAKVLEIGTNVGRTARVISFLLHDETNFVTMEANRSSFNMAVINRDTNPKRNYHIEHAALSRTPMYSHDMDCIPEPRDGYEPVPIMTFSDLKQKHPINFDTLIVDCEGAFYNIYKEFPEVLDNIKLVIVENDYHHRKEKTFIDVAFSTHGLQCVYRESFLGHNVPCEDCFYEVWQKLN